MAVAAGAQITNNSWGGSEYSQALRDAIAAAGQAGQLFIAAAGNGGSDGIGDDNDTTPHYPSNYDLDNIIAVAATDHNDHRAGFSTSAPPPWTWAPPAWTFSAPSPTTST